MMMAVVMIMIIMAQEETGMMYLYCETKISYHYTDIYIPALNMHHFFPFPFASVLHYHLTNEVYSNMIMTGGGWCRTGVWSC
jgi:hypothetical protein